MLPSRPSRIATLLQVLATSGYGAWLWLGLSLLLGLGPLGRSGTLVPLGLGAALVSIGLLPACLQVLGFSHWHGWRPHTEHYPTRSALMALANWLPVLAVAGLAQGNNGFWAIRLAGALLILCSLANLLLSAHDDRSFLPATLQRATALLPAGRITTAAYSGGLWLWLVVLAQGEFAGHYGTYPRIMLLVLALGLGLLESALWQSSREPETPSGVSRGTLATRLVAALLTYALPCAALLLSGVTDSLVAAALAAPSCVLGQWLERRLYEGTLAAALDANSP